jgi:hypothetical protein
MKQVRDSSDSSAYVVLNKKGLHVATVQARYGSGGGVQVDVWAAKPGETWHSLVHQHKAGGYGYDKFAAALAGAVIDGHKLANHCGYGDAAHEEKKAVLLRQYQRAVTQGLTREETAAYEEKARRIGCRFANWNTPAVGQPHAWGSLHTVAGLERLEMLGYRVIKAL